MKQYRGMLELYFRQISAQQAVAFWSCTLDKTVHRKQSLSKNYISLVALVQQPCWHLSQYLTGGMTLLDK